MKKQFNILNYFIMRSLFMGIGVSKILTQSKEYYFLSIIIGSILGLLMLSLIQVSVKKHKINIIISSLLFILNLIILLNIVSTMYLSDMPRFLIGLPIILLIMYILSKKETIIFRLSNILIIINIVFFTTSFISLIPYIDLNNFTYTNTPIENIILSSIEYALISVTPTLIAKEKKYENISIIKTYLVSSISMFIMFTLTIGILGPNLVSTYRYPEYIILKRISILNFIENVQNIISFIWLIDIFMSLVVFGNNIKKNVKISWLLNIILIILLIISTIITYYYNCLLFVYKYISFILLIILSLIYLINKKKTNPL